jgi:hypothetical protein
MYCEVSHGCGTSVYFDLESYKELKTKLTTAEKVDTRLEEVQMTDF